MAGEFDAGSVFIGFKTNTDSIASGFTQANKIVKSFGDTVLKVADEVAAGSKTMTSSLGTVTGSFSAIEDGTGKMQTAFNKQFIMLKEFSRGVNKASNETLQAGRNFDRAMDDGFSRNEAKHTAKIANLIGRLINLQLAMSQLNDRGGRDATKFDEVVGGLSKGFSTFAVVLSLVPNQAGLVIGGILGVATALSTLLGPTEAETKAAEKLKTELQGINEQLEAIDKRADRAGRAQALEEQFPLAPVGKSGEQQRQDANLQGRQDAIDKILANQERINNLAKERNALETRLQAAEGDALNPLGLFKESAETVRELIAKNREEMVQSFDNIAAAKDAVKDLTKATLDYQSVLEKANLRDNLIKSVTDQLGQIDLQLKDNKTNLDEGLTQPLEAANTEAGLLLQKAKLLNDFSNQIAALPPELRNGIPTFPKGTKEAIDAGEKAKQQQATKAQGDALAASIGSAVHDGILNGAKAMEIVANVGRNLFDNMLTNVIGKFQTGLSAAFEAVGGKGAGVLGDAIVGVLGVVGGILSKKGGVASQSFNAAQNLIESSQSVRGVVSGPTNVAIAALGENLKRAMAGVEARLDVMIQLMQRGLRAGTSGATAPDVQVAGTVNP